MMEVLAVYLITFCLTSIPVGIGYAIYKRIRAGKG